MSNSKKPKLSEIRALQAQVIHTDEDFTQLLHTYLPHLLDLVARTGKAFDKYCAHDATCNHRDIFEPRCDCGLEEARELLKELEL